MTTRQDHVCDNSWKRLEDFLVDDVCYTLDFKKFRPKFFAVFF